MTPGTCWARSSGTTRCRTTWPARRSSTRRSSGGRSAPNTMNAQRYTLLQAAGGAAVAGLMPIPEQPQGVPAVWMGYIGGRRRRGLCRKGEGGGRGDPSRPDGHPQRRDLRGRRRSGRRRIPALPRLEQRSACPRGAHARPRRLARTERAATARRRSPSIRACSAGRRRARCRWGRRTNTSSSRRRAGRKARVFTKDAETPHPFWRLYFNVEAIDAAIERVKAAGGKIMNGPHEVPGRALDRPCPRSPGRRLRARRAEAVSVRPQPGKGNEMRVMVIVKATKDSEAGEADPGAYAGHGRLQPEADRGGADDRRRRPQAHEPGRPRRLLGRGARGVARALRQCRGSRRRATGSGR